MTRRLLYFTAFSALVAGLILFWQDPDLAGRPGGGPPQPEPAAENGADEQHASPDEEPRDRPTREQVDNPARGGAGEPRSYRRHLSGLRGRLIWAGSRAPIAGVEVLVGEAWLDAIVPSLEDLVGVEKMRSPVVFKAKGRSGADGVFEIHGVHGRAAMFLAIGLQTDKVAVRLVDRVPARGELVDLGDIELLERGAVTGRVVDDAGAPVVGARVRVVDLPQIVFQFGAGHYDPEGMALIVQGPYRVVLEFPPWLKKLDKMLPFCEGYTDGEGQFSIAGVRPGSATAVITKPNHSPVTRSIPVVPEQDNELGVIGMGMGELLSGRFVDTDGKPVTGVQVTAGGVMSLVPFGLVKKPATVDAEGEFEISGLPRNSLYLCYKRKAGQPWEVSGPHRGDDDVEIVLGAMRSGTVRLVLRGGGTVPSKVAFDLVVADVPLYMPGFGTHIPGRGHFFRQTARPDMWDVRELPGGIYKVIAKAPGFAFGTGVLDLTKDAVEDRSTEIELVPSPVQRFEARDKAGAPVEAARVYWNASPGRSMEKGRRQRLTRLPIVLGRTAADGVLETDAVEEGGRRFYCRHPGYALAASSASVRPGKVIRFVLGKTGSVSGFVAEDGRPPSQPHTVLAEPVGNLGRTFAGLLMPRFTATGPDGGFAFPDMQPGSWRVRSIPDVGSARSPAELFRLARGTSGRGPSQRVLVHAGVESFVRLAVREKTAGGRGSIAGFVLVGGKPEQGVWVQTWAGARRADVKEDGTFALTGLTDGNVWISVEREGHDGLLPNRLWEGRVEIRNGGQQVLNLDLQVGSATVEVVDTGGRGVKGLLLELIGEKKASGEHSGQVRVVMATDSNGRAEFAGVPVGSYAVRSVMARNPGMVIPEASVHVFRGRGSVARITARAPAVASGTIVFVESELTEAKEREYARKRRPTYLVFESEGRFIWGPAREENGVVRFRMRPGPPGTYHLRSRGKLRWVSSPLVVRPKGVRDVVVRLRPDAAQVRAALAKLEPKPKSRKSRKDGKRGSR